MNIEQIQTTLDQYIEELGGILDRFTKTRDSIHTALNFQISPAYRPKLEAQKTCDIIHPNS